MFRLYLIAFSVDLHSSAWKGVLLLPRHRCGRGDVSLGGCITPWLGRFAVSMLRTWIGEMSWATF